MASAVGLVQLPNDHAALGISVIPLRTPRLFSRAIEISFAGPSSTGLRPAPGSGRLVPETSTKRAKVGLEMPAATGTCTVSAAVLPLLNGRSACQPLAR